MNHLGWFPKAQGELRREVCPIFLALFSRCPQRPVDVKEVGKGAKGSSASKMGGLYSVCISLPPPLVSIFLPFKASCFWPPDFPPFCISPKPR